MTAKNPDCFASQRGFALVVALSLMILLTVIAVGLLTISSISLRTAQATTAMAEARANARLSMMLALGQLQVLAGNDTRVSASSETLLPTSAPVTGVWRSWEGVDRDDTGKPIAPDYDAKKRAGDPSKALADAADGRFLGWLSSTAYGIAPDPAIVPDVAKASANGLVRMVSTGSSRDTDREVHMRPTFVNNSRGGIAWWVSGENAKAMVNVDRVDDPATLVAWHQRVKSNGRADATHFGIPKVDDFPKTLQLPTTGSLKLAEKSADLRRIHDLTGFSRGLLTNTATGGWRKDLSVFSERYTSLPSTDLPTLTIKPGRIQKMSKAQPSAHPANPLLYPWAKYRSSPTSSGWAQVPPICSWDALIDYTQQYKSLTSSSATRTSMSSFIFSHGPASDRYNFQDKVRRCPQIARIHWIYSLCSVVANATNEPDATKHGKFKPALMITPVLTLWNPYNVQIAINSFGVNIQETAPLRFAFKIGGQTYPETSLTEITKAGTGYQRFFLKVDQAITLAPGATRIFGLSDATPRENSSAGNIQLAPGYRPGGGFLFYGLNKGQNIYANSGDPFAVERISYDATTTEGGGGTGAKSGLGIIYDIHVDGGSKSAHRMIYEAGELGGASVVNGLYPPITVPAATTVGDVQGIKNRPFASAIFGYRMVSPPSRDPRHLHLFSKGMLQANPLCFYTEIGFGDNNDAVNTMAGTGVYHPINAPYDFAFQEVQGWNDTLAIPQFESGTNSSYIVSGLSAGDGLTRCVMAELPTRPLQSLAELQHFDARNNNPITPFQYNLIGNGSANPIFAPNQISVTTSYNNGMCNDDTYMLNQMLFDDWFVSSIVPDLRDFSPSARRTMQKVYEDHLNATTPLPNRFYLPARGAVTTTAAAAATDIMSTGKDRNQMFRYETVASKLEVMGMFNINSVSVEAWKALLRQSRNLQVPYLNAAGATVDGAASGFPYPRTSIAGDAAAGSGSKASNPLFPQADQFAGHRALTDAQIDALAAEIVKEIRARGPFLSLAEFVNRRISSDKNLAIAGAVQKALDNLASSGSSASNPFATLQSLAVEVTTKPPGNTDYKFPEAALGSSAFGVPGWIRQADILRPLAPLISARDDTFTIRGYGDARDKTDKNKVLARAWCEVVVKRQATFVDPSDEETVLPNSTQMKSAINRRFGRGFEIVSFRWLDEREV